MRQLLQKTSQLTVFIVLLGTLFPILAFAATGFKDVTYRNGTVSGTVYSDVYKPSITESVYIYDSVGSYIGAATTTGVTYSVYDGVYNYGFNAYVGNSYKYLNLLEKVTDSVYQAVYNTTPDNGSSGGGRRGGGGGGVPSYGSTINVPSDGTVDAYALSNALSQYDTVELSLSGDIALIPAKALVDYVSTSKVLRITNSNGTYIIPLSVLKLSDLAEKLGISVDDMKIKVSISAVSESTASDIAAAASALGGSVAGKSADFDIVAVGTDNKTQAIDFGNKYISRILTIDKTVDSSKATGVLYDPITKKLSFVPAVFSTSDSKTEATLKRNGSSIYSVIELSKSFDDIKGHWAQSYVELLANKLVVDGMTDSEFAPDRNISRAEFAALVVRALGLTQGGYSGSFKDVDAGAWYASVVGAAVNAKLIEGYEDGSFRPDAQITREELGAMVVRALDYAGAKPELSADDQSAMLGKFKDADRIVWAQKELATAIKAGIIDGMTDDTIGSNLQATRAQSATMLKRLLANANFIN
ncbi:S-layer homology domain-containing protein [Paenibacillus hamazuiensis]|uniref:S-layer homology domain-containing protein n=1 Tax=Paenibacillus hamazuiensis TaxID=2936508 RepID=UPI0020102451|nr:S-layer homology domain-containing protein [Paenibacillus hamazuiensis]